MITNLNLDRLSASVMAVPPLCRNADFSLNEAENGKLIRHIEAGGIRTLLYGGNANFYHIGVSEYDQVLSCIGSHAGADTLVIPSVSPLWGPMMDQAKIIRKHKFPTVMVLPIVGTTTSRGVEEGVRRFADAAGVPALLYIKNDGYIDVPEVKRLAESKTISGVKYAVVRPNFSQDPYLRDLVNQVGPRMIISGVGEQAAVAHMRDFGLPGFTAGGVCVAPAMCVAMLKAIRAGDWARADHIRELFLPLENYRVSINPVRVLHEAVRLAGIANTGPLLPLMSNLEESWFPKIREAIKAVLDAQARIVGA
jgi:dihydrodipicolinate synthase/N-acetylneuraminate lyase